jgi:hypothetical protein
MYLQLKPRCITATTEHSHARQSLSRDLHEQLIESNLDNFDWIHGGQTGPIKFIDIHQLEFATSRALKGSLVATLMVNLNLEGIKHLIIPEHGGACQYATGARWNNRNQLTTLAGQAIVLQALALGAGLRRRISDFELGRGISVFVAMNAQEIGLLPSSGYAGDSDAPLGARLRDNAWYATALHLFANSYRSADLSSVADQLFASIVTNHLNGSTSCVDKVFGRSKFKLDQIVAVASALTHFGKINGKQQLLNQAKTLICAFVPRYHCIGGGYAQACFQQADCGAEIDIDCTIDLVRTCLSLLRAMPSRRLWSIVQHGVCGLFNPAIALARRPETGILLVAGELAELSTRRTTSKFAASV